MKLLHHTHFGPRMPAFRGDLFLCEDYCTYTQKCNITYYVPFLSSEWKSSQNFRLWVAFYIFISPWSKHTKSSCIKRILGWNFGIYKHIFWWLNEHMGGTKYVNDVVSANNVYNKCHLLLHPFYGLCCKREVTLWFIIPSSCSYCEGQFVH